MGGRKGGKMHCQGRREAGEQLRERSGQFPGLSTPSSMELQTGTKNFG